MSARHDGQRFKRVSWTAIKAVAEAMRVERPKTCGRLHLKPVMTWHGRCPAFRPLTEQDANRATRL